VLDCVSGYLVFAEALAQGGASTYALNFGPRERTGRSVAELVDAVQAALGAKQGWTQAPGPQPKEMPALALSRDKAEAILGWRPRLDAAQTIEWTADWYKAFAAGEDAAATTLRQIRRFASDD
jgi:CDP-glucose 4,6-dehydratase